MNQLALDPQPPSPEYRRIPLTKGQFATVDVDDYERLNRWKWHALWNPTIRGYYAVRHDSNGHTVYMHREIMQPPAGLEVDHRDRCTLNNWRKNLRIATRAQNSWNQGKRRSNTSGFKGVYWHGEAKRWYSQIMVNGRSKHLGFYETAGAAGEAYSIAARNLHGEFSGV